MTEPFRSPELRGWHFDRVAVVYVRQSTPQQVSDHQESTARQYALVDRAVEFGWPRERALIIDDDLGKSGQSIEGRPGFQRLLAEVALDHVGLILGLEMSRLARSNRDWHQLLELCARSRVLLADTEGIYDPADHNDRLLLGLHGMMSEAELHVLKERMYQGKLNKARRGALLGRARHDRPGAPRQGPSLLAGLLRCGRCGRRMCVRYSGAKNLHSYNCSRRTSSYGVPLCQSLSGPVLDELITGRILSAVAPAALEASLAAVAEVERERAELARHWHLRRERARYEAERAARQYQACEPENRLVARELERRWEEALKRQRQLEDDFARWQRTAPGRLTPEDEQAIRGLAADLPAVWQAATTTPAERQRIARLLIEHVSVSADKASERVDVEVHWAGGLVESHTVSRPVKRYDLLADSPRLVERLRAWCAQRLSAAEIAARLNAEGFRPPKRAARFTRSIVQRLLWHLGLDRREPHGSLAGLGRDEYRPSSLARRLGISRDTVRRWLRAGWLTARRDAEGHHVIWADASELRRLRELHRLPRTWATKERLARLKQPKPRPER